MLPPEDADKEEDRRNAPGHADHHDHLVARSPGAILGGDLDRAEPVHGDQLGRQRCQTFFSSSLMLRQNWAERLSLASLSSLV